MNDLPSDTAPLRRDLSSTVAMRVHDRTSFAFATAVAADVPLAFESFRVVLDENPVEWRVVVDAHGTRLHVFETPPGVLRVEYSAAVIGLTAPAPVAPSDPQVYCRPSRYVQSDSLTDFARDTFGRMDRRTLAHAVADWVHDRLEYVPEASSPTGGALETLASGKGVCRDYAHLTAALLRALDVPARMASVYAPGLEPRDFHAVVEVLVDGKWILVDASRLAPRSRMVRIATGRDATDTAWGTNTLADIDLLSIEVHAYASDLPGDDATGEAELR